LTFRKIFVNIGLMEKEPFFVAPGVHIVGDVEFGELVNIWYGAVIRGDIAPVKIGARTNIQDNAVIHVDFDLPAIIGEDVTIGHGAIVHGAVVEDCCLIGMGAIILSGARIGKGSIIAAGALVREHQEIPERSLVVGIPGKIIREVTDEELEKIKESALHYIELAKLHKGGKYESL